MSIIERVEVGDITISNPARIRDDDVAFVLLADISAHCTFWAKFSFYNSDFTRMIGSSVYGFGRDVKAAALLASEGKDVSVEIVLNKDNFVVDFGEIEPDDSGTSSHS